MAVPSNSSVGGGDNRLITTGLSSPVRLVRGSGITVIDELYELNKILKSKEKHPNGNDKTYIVQAYLDRPLLYHRRKFDLRHYMLITTLYGRMKAYWYS